MTAECLQASINAAVGADNVYVFGSADHAVFEARRPTVTPRAYKATEDRAGWVHASWQCINGGEPSRERRFHASGCRWSPKSRRWTCSDGCNIPQWTEEEADADE